VTGHSWEMFEKLGVVWNSSARCEKKKKKKKKKKKNFLLM
jgi:hypothetical protein